MALDQRRQGRFGAAGFRGHGRAGYSADALVPASQAVDWLFAGLSGNAALPRLCSIVPRNGALAADLKTYIVLETACSHAFGKRIRDCSGARFRQAVGGLMMRSPFFN